MFRDHRLLRPEGRPDAPAAVYALGLFAFIAATRWGLAPHYLYSFDKANFALALENFNPALHQPQPPGYPLFVALIRFIHIWIARPEEVMLIAGLLAACAATLLIFLLGSELFGRSAGILAAALLASDPAFWFGGVTNQVRLFLALAATGVPLLAWRALRRPKQPAALYLAFAALGVAAGFRTIQAILIFPLLVWVWARTGRSVWRLALAFACLLVALLPSILVTIQAVGGWRATYDMLWAYAMDQFHGSSAVFGASRHAAWRMFVEAVVWNFLGALAWLWALPFLPFKAPSGDQRLKAAFLTLCFFPCFLFSAFIHIGDPDQALGSIPSLCILGGLVLSLFLRRTHTRSVFPAAALVVAIHALLFFFPPGKFAKASSYRAVRDVERMNTAAFTAIHDLRDNRPLTIVHFGSSVPYRQLEYYFPDDYVDVLPGRPLQPQPEHSVIAYFHRLNVPTSARSGILNPDTRRVILGNRSDKNFIASRVETLWIGVL